MLTQQSHTENKKPLLCLAISVDIYTLSRRAPSATRAPLPLIFRPFPNS